jgi:hypothetical protein
MQPTTRFHDSIANPTLPEAYLIFPHPVTLHSTDRVFNSDADGRDRTIDRFLQWGQFPTRGFFLGLDNRHPITRIPLEAPVLIVTTAGWEGIAFQISEALIIRLPVIGGTQEANLTGFIDPAEGFARVALLLATVECLLVLGIGRAVDWSLRTILPTRGGVEAPAVRVAASITAKASAVRAGRSSWRAKV